MLVRPDPGGPVYPKSQIRFPSPVGIFPRSIRRSGVNPAAAAAAAGASTTGVMAPPRDPFADLWGQADARVRAQIEPLLAELARQQGEEEARARATADAWRAGIPGIIEQHRGPVAQIYSEAQSQGQKMEEALANRLSAVGGTASQGMSEQLARQGAPASSMPDDLGQMYRGAAAASQASGIADLAALNVRGAEARNWLEQQGVLAQEQATDQFTELLSDIFSRYGEQKGELTAQLPGSIDEMFERLKGDQLEKQQAEAESAAQQMELQQNAWKDRQDILLKERTLALAYGDKKAARALDAQLKREKMQFDAGQKDLDRIVRMRGQDVTTRGQDVTAETAAANRAAADKRAENGGGSATDSWNTPGSAKQDRVRQTAFSGVSTPAGQWPPSVLRKLKASPGAADGIIDGAINAKLSSMNIPLNDPAAKKIKQAIRKQISGRKWVDNKGKSWTFSWK